MTDSARSTPDQRLSRDPLVVASVECLDRFSDLVGRLGPDDWTARSLCPDWSVLEVVAHVVGIEEALAGWSPNPDEFIAFEKSAELVEAAPTMPRAELIAHLSEVFRARRSDLDRLTDLDVAADSMTPVGVHPYARFLAIRVFDIWVHERDIRIPLDRPSNDGGLAAEIAIDEIERSVGYIVGKKIGLPDQMSIRFDLRGPVERRIGARVDGRAAPVADLDDPDVVVSADSTAFVMLACGRIDPQEMIDAGRIEWSGDDEWGEHAARNLAFTF